MKKLLTAFALVLMLLGCGVSRPTLTPTYVPFKESNETTLRRQTLTQQLSELRTYKKQAQGSSGKGFFSKNSASSGADVGDIQAQIDYLEDQLASLPAVGSGSNLSGNLSGGSSYDAAPCVTGACGSVNVRGYYRKDGTYVRPHSRSRPGSVSGRSRGRR